MSHPDAPPPVLDSARVLAYAVLDESVEWTGRQLIFVNGEELGRVPRLALCQYLNDHDGEVFVFHCNDDWEVLGFSSAETVDGAKAKAERAYSGVSAKWIDMDVSIEHAKARMDANHEDLSCSFCGRQPDQVSSLVQSNSGARICDHCVRELYEQLAQDDVV